MNYGYHSSLIESDHYVFGASSLPKDILQADGNWEKYLPVFESQAVNFESDGCVPFGTIHAVVILMKKIFGGDFDYAERYIYNLANITPPIGSDPHAVAELIRKQGVITQALLPMTTTLTEYMTPRPMTATYLAEGSQWLTEHSFGHEWVWTNNPTRQVRIALLKEALQYSPVCLCVTAWHQKGDGTYEDLGQPNNHWVCCFKMDGDSPVIFDSYSHDGSPIKTLDPDHHIEMAKRYYIGVGSTPDPEHNWFVGMLKALFQTLGFIKEEIQTLPKPPIVNPPEIYTQPNDKYSLDNLCLAIRDYEGKPGDLSYRNNNPGNCRCSKVGYKSIYGEVKCVNNFAVFPTATQGMLYLRNLIKETIAEHPDWTLYQYFALKHAPVSDGNNPLEYSETVAKQIGCTIDTKISSFTS